jgi:hypothetical protein
MVNPTKEIPASAMELSFWQLGGLGLVAPKGVVYYRPVTITNERILHGAFVWDQQRYTNVVPASFPSYLSVTRLGVGAHQFDFDAQVTDLNGDLALLELKFGIAAPCESPANQRAEVEVVSDSPASIIVRTRNAAGALVDSSFVLVVI